jgi:hypothetical protein
MSRRELVAIFSAAIMLSALVGSAIGYLAAKLAQEIVR